MCCPEFTEKCNFNQHFMVFLRKAKRENQNIKTTKNNRYNRRHYFYYTHFTHVRKSQNRVGTNNNTKIGCTRSSGDVNARQ